MATILSQILDRIDVILKAHVPTGTKVYRDRAEAESREEAPSINVVTRDDRTESYSSEMDYHTVLIELRIYVRSEPVTPAAEAIHEAIHRPLVDDDVLKTLTESRRLEGAAFDPQEADVTALLKSATYRFTYLIQQNTL